MKLKLPEECIKHDVCKYVGDDGCWNGCDHRVEKNTEQLEDIRNYIDNMREVKMSSESILSHVDGTLRQLITKLTIGD